MTPSITFNDQIKLILADVDETIADVYCPAEPEMITELNKVLAEGRILFLVTGGSFKRVQAGIIEKVEPSLRHRILVSHCSGAEVWGYNTNGSVLDKPYYSLYDIKMSNEEKRMFRVIIQQIVDEFKLRTHPVMPKLQFIEEFGKHRSKLCLMIEAPK